MNREFNILIRDRLVWKPYNRKKKIYFTRYRTSSLKRFRKFIDISFENHPGEFLLKDDKGKTFIRFTVLDSKMIKIFKTRPNGCRYPLWNYMRESKFPGY